MFYLPLASIEDVLKNKPHLVLGQTLLNQMHLLVHWHPAFSKCWREFCAERAPGYLAKKITLLWLWASSQHCLLTQIFMIGFLFLGSHLCCYYCLFCCFIFRSRGESCFLSQSSSEYFRIYN